MILTVVKPVFDLTDRRQPDLASSFKSHWSTLSGARDQNQFGKDETRALFAPDAG